MVSYLDIDDDLLFPDSDGQPMADNTEQYEWIVKIKENLEIIFADDPKVFIAGDLLWYPLRSTLVSPVAPDVMVAFGRPKGERGSYQQWKENNIPPQVVFEILSPGNTQTEMTRKLLFYDRYGVEEYYIYNPDKNDLGGCIRRENRLESRENLDNWVSPRLGIRFQLAQPELLLYYPDGQPFTSYNQERQRAEAERQRAETERQRAETESQRAEAERQRAERLAAKLRQLNISPEEI